MLAVTSAQRDEMDGLEGHPEYYDRTRFTGSITLNDGSRPAVEVYLGTPGRRPPRLVNGRSLRCSEVPYTVVDQLVPRRA